MFTDYTDHLRKQHHLDTWLMQLADRKARVSGKYYGHDFTGTAIKSRQHTVSYREEIYIALDQPITVFNLTRDNIIMYAQDIEHRPDHFTLCEIGDKQ